MATMLEPSDDLTRPGSPDSPLSPMGRNFDLSSSTIDELTSVLNDLNRAPASLDTHGLTCCCGKDACQNTLAWLDIKSKLETRLILSAEVGQALLQKHEAYVEQNEKSRHKRASSKQATFTFSNGGGDDELTSEAKLNKEYDLLAKEKAEIEKRLNHALVNNEVTEVSNKTLLQELQDARDTISRLTAHHARSVGWDARLAAALKEKEDMQQEMESETNRARLAESRFAVLKDKTNKLQAEVRRLQESLEEKRGHRLEVSDHILHEARAKLETVKSTVGLTAKAEQDQLAEVLESLVNDNDTLKQDNAELQRMLSEARDDVHALQEEVEERRAAQYPPPRSGPTTPLSRHFQTGSTSSVFNTGRRSFQFETSPRFNPTTEPLTPDSGRRPLSPLESLAPPEKWNTFTYPVNRSRNVSQSSHLSYNLEVDDTTTEEDAPEVEKKGPRPLLLLTRSRGIQTDPWMAVPSPSPLPSHFSGVSTPPDPRSESSSISETLSSHTSALLERATGLLNKMTQADAFTLTTRLKRQNLKGADLSHLSRTTVSNIVAEAIELRAQFRSLLEDDKLVVTCTRKDLRVLFKLLKDMFMEMGQLRVTMNDVIFDPSCAPRVSELSLNPSKAAAEREKQSIDLASRLQGAASWITPISKLFGSGGAARKEEHPPTLRAVSNPGQAMGRLAVKSGPAMAASTTTVNVEFSGGGVGRSTTSLAPPQAITVTPPSLARPSLNATSSNKSANVMSIFAGAPKPALTEADPWVVLPRGPQPARRVQSSYFRPESGTATIGRSTMRRAAKGLSRNVDAVIDAEHTRGLTEVDETLVEDEVPELPERQKTLRRRGLSDSSIHSTFTTHAKDGSEPPSPVSPTRPAIAQASAGRLSGLPWGDRVSVFQALSKTVNNLRISATGAMSSTPPTSQQQHGRSSSGTRSPSTTSHAAVGTCSPSTSSAKSPAISSPPLPPPTAAANDNASRLPKAIVTSTTSNSGGAALQRRTSRSKPSSPVTPIKSPGLSLPETPTPASGRQLGGVGRKKGSLSSPLGGIGFLPGNASGMWAGAEDGVMSSDPAVLAAAGSLREDSGFKTFMGQRSGEGRGMRDFI